MNKGNRRKNESLEKSEVGIVKNSIIIFNNSLIKKGRPTKPGSLKGGCMNTGSFERVRTNKHNSQTKIKI